MSLNLIQAGDVGLSHGSDWQDVMIRIGQRLRFRSKASEWNHAFLMQDNLYTIEAMPRGMTQLDLSNHIEEYTIWRPPYAPGRGQDAAAAGVELVKTTTPYGYLTIASEALFCLTGGGLRFGWEHTAICSGAVAYMLTRAGLDLGIDEEYIVPAQLGAIAEASWKLIYTHTAH